MYCVKCGVELADSEKKCPLCNTFVYHPTIKQSETELTFPPEPPREEFNRTGMLFILTFIFAIPLILCLVCDVCINGSIEWSGYAVCAILLTYILAVLPIWFKRPSAFVFVPVDFAAVGLYLLYINYKLDGDWFLTLALPLVVMSMLLVGSLVILTNKFKRRYFLLYVYGGASMLLGCFCVLTEFFLNLTIFTLSKGFIWSIYPLIVLFLVGIMLIIIAIVKPFRESLYKKFFI